MTARYSSIAVVLLIASAPVLLLPALLGPDVAAVVATVALLGAFVFVSDLGHLPWYVGVLALMALAGWVAASNTPDTINHFCGLAFGLLAMATIAAWCRTRERLVLVAVLFLLCGALALSIGSRSTPPVHTSKALFKESTTAVETMNTLPLRALHSRQTVNRNALAATAMMVLPIAVAVALSPPAWPGLQTWVQLAGFLTAAWAAIIVVLMQSRSAWLSAVIVLWVWARGAMRTRLWWLTTGVVFLAVPAALYFMWGDHAQVVEVVTAVQARIDIWKQGVQALRPSPWFGIGFDYFRHSGYSPVLVWPDLTTGRPHAHNFFLQTALDVGLIGLVAYLGVLGNVIRRAVETMALKGVERWVRRLAGAAALSVLSVHAYGLLDAVPLGAKVGAFQWLSQGLVLAAWRLARRDPRPSEGPGA